jgi:thiol-disulfide isomerase/thioredoxin
MSDDDQLLPQSSAPDARPASVPPAAPAPRRPTTRGTIPERLVVPSCVVVGRQVVDFALYDIDGKVWELSKKRDSSSKLMLIDFWSTTCTHCKEPLRFMVKLNRDYRRHGLDVVGIANEEGTFEEKQKAVREKRLEYGINFPLLLSGGGRGPCPVLRQFKVESLPTLVLIDGSGKIVWGPVSRLNDYYKRNLEWEIQRRLGLRQAP